MNAEILLNHFDRLSEAPDAIPRLRRFILDLAVRGKLVEQDPNDEPAAELIKRIRAEKVRLVKEGLIKNEKSLESVNVEPHSIPDNWIWIRLGESGRIFNGNSVNDGEKTELAKYREGFPFIATKDVGYGRDHLNYENGLKVPFTATSFKVAHANAILICAEGGSAGKKIGLTDRDICFGNKLYANEVWNGIHPSYILAIYESPTFFSEFTARMTGIIGGIARSEFLMLPIPLPPDAEQHRIVAKVDELMALCDQLEAAKAEREQSRDRLLASSLQRLNDLGLSRHDGVSAQSKQSVIPAGKRVSSATDGKLQTVHGDWIPAVHAGMTDGESIAFFLNHLPRITTRPTHIKQLRQTILNLAVRGKLVAQDTNDEQAKSPAASRVEKFALSKIDEDVPFELPIAWQWMRLGQISELINGDRGKNYPNKVEYVQKGVPWINTGHIEPDGTLSIDSMHYITRKKFDSLRSGKIRFGDLIYCLRGATIGKTAIITQFEEGAVASSLVIIRLSTTVNPRFAYRFLTSPLAREQIFQFDNGSAQPNLSASNVKKYWIPAPPLPEQHRIVAKVDELMALCDQLETQLTTTAADSRRLLEAVLHETLSPVLEKAA